MSELEGYLAQIQAQGQKIGSGSFSLDSAAARRKLGHFFDPNQLDFLHYWVRFAVACSAGRIEIELESKQIVFRFPGLVRQEDELVGGGVLGTSLTTRYLHYGILGAFQQGFVEVDVFSGTFAQRFCHDDRRVDIKNRAHVEGCLLTALPQPHHRHWRDLNLLAQALEFPFLETPLLLQGKSLSRPHSLLNSRATDRNGRIWCMQLRKGQGNDWDQGLEPAHARLLVHGADLASLSALSFPPGTTVWLECPQIPLDLSLRKVRQSSQSLQMEEHLGPLMGQVLLERLRHQPDLWRILSPATLDWLADHQCSQGQWQEALKTSLIATAREAPNHVHPLHAAIWERAALLAARLKDTQAEDLQKRAQALWRPLQQQAAQADPRWRDGELVQALPEGQWTAALYQQRWVKMVEAGCLGRSRLAMLTPVLKNTRGVITLHLHRELLRQSVFVEEAALSPEFLAHLKRYRLDSLLYNVLYLENWVIRQQRESSSVLYASQVVWSAVVGGEPLPDLPDIGDLTFAQKLSLCKLVHEVSLRACDKMGDEFRKLREDCWRWQQAQEEG